MDNLKLKVAEHFTFKDLVYSATAVELGLVNNPNLEELITCIRTAQEMEKVRELLESKPIITSSWFRSPAVNTAVGSVNPESQHTKGEAVDFICPSFGTPKDVARAISISSLPFDQLILEHTWVHISFAIRTQKPRRMVLSLLSNKKYAQGLTDKSGNPYIF